MDKSPPKHPTITTAAAIISPTTPVSNLYDSYEFRAISKQLNRAIKGSNGPLSPYSCYLRSATPFYSKQARQTICGSNTRNGVLCTKKEATLRSKGFVWRLWAKSKNQGEEKTENVRAIGRNSRASEVVAAATAGCIGAGGSVGGGGSDLRWPPVVVAILEALVVEACKSPSLSSPSSMASFSVPCPKTSALFAPHTSPNHNRNHRSTSIVLFHSDSKSNRALVSGSSSPRVQATKRNQNGAMKVSAQLNEADQEKPSNSAQSSENSSKISSSKTTVPDVASLTAFMNQVAGLVEYANNFL
ncbi:hypothetical protein R6Q57_018256 [Mikania cordata]